MYNINDVKIKLIDESVQRLVDIPDEVYFGEEYRSFVSNSSMALINPAQGGSPSKFLAGFKGSKSSGGALELGTAVHRMILEKDRYFIDDVVKPSAKVALVMDYYYQALKDGCEETDETIKYAMQAADYYANNITQNRIDKVLEEGKVYLQHLYDKENCEGCITLTQEHKDKLDKCLISVKNNEKIMSFLRGQEGENFLTHNEDVMIMKAVAEVPSKDADDFEDKEAELWIKVKIDNWTIDFEKKEVILNDLKTTGSSIADFIGGENENMSLEGQIYKTKSYGSFEKFHYYRQMALYMRVLQAYVKEKYDATEDNGWKFICNMLVVETNEPHYSHAFTVGERWLNLGAYEYESLLKRLAYHKTYGYDSFVNINLNGVTVIW